MDTFDSVFAELVDLGHETTASVSGRTAAGRKWRVGFSVAPSGDLGEEQVWLDSAAEGSIIKGSATLKGGNKGAVSSGNKVVTGDDATRLVGRLLGLVTTPKPKRGRGTKADTIDAETGEPSANGSPV